MLDLSYLIPSVIAVGSTNPVKINAVKTVLDKPTLNQITILSTEVESDVSHQPRSDRETRQGAINRASVALKNTPSADWGIGLEGGVRDIKYNYQGKNKEELIEVAWCAITDRQGNLALGGGAEFQLPNLISRKLKAGGELGPIMDELLNDHDVKKKEGAIGTLSVNLLTRQDIYEQLVKLALVKFISLTKQPQWW